MNWFTPRQLLYHSISWAVPFLMPHSCEMDGVSVIACLNEIAIMCWMDFSLVVLLYVWRVFHLISKYVWGNKIALTQHNVGSTENNWDINNKKLSICTQLLHSVVLPIATTLSRVELTVNWLFNLPHLTDLWCNEKENPSGLPLYSPVVMPVHPRNSLADVSAVLRERSAISS
jgi:hypothetical protein